MNAMTARWRDPELLLPPICVGITLVLLTPLVTAPWPLYPFSVGNALWARVLIAAVFAAWVLLRPRWHPPPKKWTKKVSAVLSGPAIAVFIVPSVGTAAAPLRDAIRRPASGQTLPLVGAGRAPGAHRYRFL